MYLRHLETGWHARCKCPRITIKDMKTIHHITSAFVAAGSIGVALLTLGNFIRADLGFSILATLGVSAFALFDYARPARSLRAPLAPVLRPVLPCESASPIAYSARRAA